MANLETMVDSSDERTNGPEQGDNPGTQENQSDAEGAEAGEQGGNRVVGGKEEDAEIDRQRGEGRMARRRAQRRHVR